MQRKIKKQEGVIEVTKTILGQETKKREKIKIRPFVTDVMTVGVKLGTVINIGNFENVKIDIYVDAPCYVEEAKEMLNQVIKFAYKRMDSEVEKLKNG